MKKLLLILLSFALFSGLFFTGCTLMKKDPYGTLKYLKNLKSYSCNVDMEITNNRQAINYTLKEFYEKKLGYRIELDQSRVFIYKDDKIFVSDLNNGMKYDTGSSFDTVYRLSFLGEYIDLLNTNEEIKHSTKTIGVRQYEIFELQIFNGNRNIDKAEMYVDEKTKLPEKIIIYDVDGKEKIKMTYSNFEPNAKLDEKLFNN